MKGLILYLIANFVLNLSISAIGYSELKQTDSVNDGPYIFNVKNKLKAVSIKNSYLVEEYITQENFAEIRTRSKFSFSYQYLTESLSRKKNHSQRFNNVDSISVVSDIHGEYETYLKLLKATGIIDDKLRWKFGKGHLVILGDIFDRGGMVTEVLWHLFGLEKQADEAGGMVHVLLGNHEIMVLSENLDYIHSKYKRVEEIARVKYFDLYSRNSVLGNWLRSKPVAITINDIIFVHGGISSELVNRRLAIRHVNELFAEKIVGKVISEIDPAIMKPPTGDTVNDTGHPGSRSETDHAEIRESEDIMVLTGDNGPVWYRGYFTDADFTEKDIDAILGYYEMKHIVVGHTTCKDIDSQYNNKIIGVDTGLGTGQPGEMLIWKNGSFFFSYSTGKRVRL